MANNTQTLKIDSKLAIRGGKLTKHGMGIINACCEYGYQDDPIMVAGITGIDADLVIEFLQR